MPVQIRVKEGDRIKRVIQIKKRLIIFIRLTVMILILIRKKIKLLKIRDFIFESIFFDIMGSEKGVIAVIADVHTIYVEIRNIINKSVIINWKRRLRIIEKYGAEEYYLIIKKSRSLATGRMLWVKKDIDNRYFRIYCSEFNYDISRFCHDNNRNEYIKENHYRFRNYRI
jgi:hypothetical protein